MPLGGPPRPDTLAEDIERAGTMAGEPGGDEAAVTLAQGARLGRYEIQEKAGSGGMGVVYRAYDPELDRGVAIKLVRVSRRDGAGAAHYRARLLREGQALARVSHPNVAVVYDVGTVGDDVFVALELIEGPTVRSWLHATRRSRDEVLELFLAAGRGLAAAHRAGIVHRDFKPDNMILGTDGRVRVLDFGLARPLAGGADGADAALASGSGTWRPRETAPGAPAAPPSRESDAGRGAALTHAGTFLGTPAYMAPEQFARTSVDAHADQFAFCVALHEAVCGRLPFAPGSRIDTAVTNGAPPERERRRHDLPRWLARIVDRGLATAPDDRFPSMDALLDALERGHQRERQAPARRRRVVFAVLAAAAVATAAAGIASRRHGDPRRACRAGADRLAGVWDEPLEARVRAAFEQSGRPYAAASWERLRAVLDARAQAWRQARLQACEATHVRGEQSGTLLDLRMQCLDRRREELRALTQLLADRPDGELVDRSVQAALGLTPLGPCADARALTAAGPPPARAEDRPKVEEARRAIERARALRRAGKPQDAVAAAREAATTAPTLGYRPVEAEALQELAEAEAAAHGWQRAREAADAALLAAEAGRQDELAARAALLQIRIHGLGLAQYEAGRGWAKRAAAAIERLGGDPVLEATRLGYEGLLYYAQADYAKARDAHQRALVLLERALGPDHLEVAATLVDLANVLDDLGQSEEALALYLRALRIREQTLGPDHPAIAGLVANIAIIHVKQRRFDEARGLNERALRINERAFGPEHATVGLTLNNLGDVLATQGRLDEALAHFRRGLALRERTLVPDHPQLATSCFNIGAALCKQGQFAAALPYLERAIRIVTKAQGPHHPDVGDALNLVGEAQLGLRRPAEAARAYERAQAIWDRTPAADAWSRAMTLMGQGRVQRARHAPAHAVELTERAVALAAKRPAEEVAEARFALAQALWDEGRDRARAVKLGEAAHAALAPLAHKRREAAEIEGWLRGKR